MIVKLLSHTPNPEEAIIRAAANCWQSVPHEGILDHIIKARHWTPLEFASFNFEISGVSRVLTHQLVRKRAGVAFAQESQRYVDQSDAGYVVPPTVTSTVYLKAIVAAQAVYDELVDSGVPKEDARYFLTNAATSNIHMSINYHALLDLASERLCTRAQWEIRELLEQIKKAVTEVSPRLGGYLQPKCYWLDWCPEKKLCANYAGEGVPQTRDENGRRVFGPGGLT